VNRSTGLTSTLDLKAKIQAPTGISGHGKYVFIAAGGKIHILEDEDYLVI